MRPADERGGVEEGGGTGGAVVVDVGDGDACEAEVVEGTLYGRVCSASHCMHARDKLKKRGDPYLAGCRVAVAVSDICSLDVVISL